MLVLPPGLAFVDLVLLVLQLPAAVVVLVSAPVVPGLTVAVVVEAVAVVVLFRKEAMLLLRMGWLP